MKRKIILRYSIGTIILIILAWTVLTLYVEATGESKQWTFGSAHTTSALVVFDPDPFYKLDEQVCLAFGKALAKDSINVMVATVAAAEALEPREFDILVYCANTYNWRPDWSITKYIESQASSTQNKPVVAITLGAGSTEWSQKYFERTIINSGGKLMESYSLWLWRPNDETKMEQPNVAVAVEMSRAWAGEIVNRIN